MPERAEDLVPTEWPTGGDPAAALLDELEDVLDPGPEALTQR